MLVICNGAIKSGSTWLFNILTKLVSLEYPSAEYLTNRSDKHPCIVPDKLTEFIAQVDIFSENYITKNHLDGNKYSSILMQHKDVYVIDIKRDIRDVIVSNYYHDCFRNGYKYEFEKYYWDEGRALAHKLNSYHKSWDSYGNNYYLSKYENLHNSFEKEVASIAEVLGLSVGIDKIGLIKEQTSIIKLRKEYKTTPRFEGEKFFRKGEIGDWKNHFSDQMLDDLKKVQRGGVSNNKLSKFFVGLKNNLNK